MTDPQILIDYEAHGLALATRPGILDDLREALECDEISAAIVEPSPTTSRPAPTSPLSVLALSGSGPPSPPLRPRWTAAPSLTTAPRLTASLRSPPAPDRGPP